MSTKQECNSGDVITSITSALVQNKNCISSVERDKMVDEASSDNLKSLFKQVILNSIAAVNVADLQKGIAQRATFQTPKSIPERAAEIRHVLLNVASKDDAFLTSKIGTALSTGVGTVGRLGSKIFGMGGRTYKKYKNITKSKKLKNRKTKKQKN